VQTAHLRDHRVPDRRAANKYKANRTEAEIHPAFIRAGCGFFSLKPMRDAPLTFNIANGTREGTTIVTLSGPLVLSNLFSLQDELRTLKPALAIFDLADSEYMDSAGLGVLVNFYVGAEKNGRKMALAGVNQRIEALLDMTHVKGLLRVFPTVADAETAA
jgi:anti-sigma B factor antagonist